MNPKRYLVTSALPYANGPLHIGHLTGAYIPADIYVRYLRLTGKDVLFVCGSDEHGAAITLRAKTEGISPRDIIDKYHPLNKAAFERLGISFDIYHRTSEELHHQTSSDFFLNLYDKGVFVEREIEQLYDQQFEQFLADRYVTGTCPKCDHENAYGDQCENCGSSLSPTELINPKSTLSGETPVLKKTRHWYLPMDRYQAAIEEWVENAQQNETWKKHVLGQCRSWLKQGLQERSMTRDLDWGVKVPLPDAEGKVLYVWLDAPIGYISATKALSNKWADYWQQPDTKLVHFIGKDNIVFHCIIFPMLLQLHGDYVLPTNVPANQFMNLEGNKMSTSRNYAIWATEYLDEFEGMEDVLRYMLITNMPENKDSDFSWLDFQARNNNELVAVLGNFINRVFVLMHKYFDGVVPEMPQNDIAAALQQADEVYTTLNDFPENIGAFIQRYEFRNALNELMNLARLGNKFITDTEPWKLYKTQPMQTAAVLGVCLEIIAYLAVFCEPFMPFTSTKMKKMLNLSEAEAGEVISAAYSIGIGHQLNKPDLLFKKLEDATIQTQIEKLQAILNAGNTQAPDVAADFVPLKSEISYEDFAKLDIRTGTITAAEKIKKADKLLKLSIDLGFEQRTVVSGIAQQYTPEDLPGRKVLLLANLAPRKLRGVESKGMILMAEDNGKFVFIAPEREDTANGCGVS